MQNTSSSQVLGEPVKSVGIFESKGKTWLEVFEY